MSYCPKCGHKVTPDAQFCHSCGTNVKEALKAVADHKPQAPRPHKKPADARPSRDQQQSNEAGVSMYRDLMAARAGKRAKSFLLIAGGVVGVLVGGFVYMGGMEGIGAIIGVPCAIVLLVGAVLMPSERLSEDEYANLPGARTSNGHQCIFCGGRGIYRHTPYKTTNTLADCSRCKNELWTE